MKQISVIGSGSCGQTSEEALLAEEVGRRLAEAGATVVCGGLGGVMDRAYRRRPAKLDAKGAGAMESAPGIVHASSSEEAVRAALEA